MRVFICEKPSMARDLAKELPGTAQKKEGYIVVGSDIVTWAYGHLLEQAEPEEYNPSYRRWAMKDLPIVPKKWKLNITKSSAKQFAVIRSLLAKADTIVHAGDPDREGQLLIDEILDYVDNKKPVQRILMNALDSKSIQEALGQLRDNRDFLPLKNSALARSRADWLMGMNLSRAYTLAARQNGYKVTFPIGRVKTPTLALVVRRQREIESFVPVPHYGLKVEYSHALGSFTAHWKPQEFQVGLDEEGRILKEDICKTLWEKIKAQPKGTVLSMSKTKKKEWQRLPLSLSALQILAGKRYGYDPQQVLAAAQQLYERKYTTYPRSDCEYLPENQRKDSKVILQHLAEVGDEELVAWVGGADVSIRSRAWNDKKITAHHAIIPTTVRCPIQKLTTMQQHIYRLIAQAYITQFYAPYEYEQVKIEIEHEKEKFLAMGRIVNVLGWKGLWKTNAKEEEGEENKVLPPVKKGDIVEALSGEVEKKTTKPPSRFTESTLLGAMKNIHLYVKKEELKRQLKEVSGIGTEATRATIIKELVQKKFLQEEGKKRYLFPTEAAYLLVDSLPEELTYPDETAVWEEKLHSMSEGKGTVETFLDQQIALVSTLVNKTKGGIAMSTEAKACPLCGKLLMRRNGKYGSFYGCSAYPKCTYTEPIREEKQEATSKERMQLEVKKDKKEGPKEGYICPRCKTGVFVKETVRGKAVWLCSNMPKCRTQCADVEGKPSIYAYKTQE